MKRLIKHIFNNLRYMDKQLFFASTILIIFGLFNIVTASSREAISIEAPLYYYFFKHGQMLLIGLFLGLIILNTDSKHYKLWTMIAYIAICICLFYLAFYGVSNRGAKNWIKIGPITFQPSEFIKPIIIVLLALLFEKFYKFFKTKNINHYNKIAVIFFTICIPSSFVFLQKDFGTMLIILIIFIFMFVTSPIFKKEKLNSALFVVVCGTLGCLLVSAVTGKKLLSEAQLDRFNYINPCKNYETSGYQICNGFIAINDGGLFGLGIGKSKQKYSYIPEPHTDSIFAIIVEEYGLIFCLFILFDYAYILWRILEISSGAHTIRGRYICLGVATYLFAHIFINLGGLFGLIPLTGVPLPFLSYGGSFLISAVCALCLVQRICIEKKKSIKNL